MKQASVDLLRDELAALDKAAEYLQFSYQRCVELAGKAELTSVELERFESLTGRFARLSDLLIQKVFRLIDQFDLEDMGTVRDRINRAEKKRLIESADEFIRIRELRNAIAHEYSADAMNEIFTLVQRYSPALLDAVARTRTYAKTLLANQR